MARALFVFRTLALTLMGPGVRPVAAESRWVAPRVRGSDAENLPTDSAFAQLSPFPHSAIFAHTHFAVLYCVCVWGGPLAYHPGPNPSPVPPRRAITPASGRRG